MDKFLAVTAVVVIGLLAVWGYWYLVPGHAPDFARAILPGLKQPALKSPVSNFKPPQFGPR